MIKKHYKKIIFFLILILFLATLITTFYFLSPEKIVNKIGIRNGYILIFIVSFFGGFSAGGSISFISLLITLSAGGINPLYLGLIAGTSLAIGDMLMFYVGSKGRALVKGKWNKKVEDFACHFKERKWLVKITPIVAYLYLGLTPFPNDVLILFLATIKYPPKKANLIIILGNFTFALLIPFLVVNGFFFF